MKRARTLLALTLAVLTSLAASSRPLFAQSDDMIHVGISPFEAHADVYYALELGLFKKAGLNVEVQQFPGGSAIVAAIAGGALQIGAGNPLPLAQAHEGGLNIVMVAPGYIYEPNAPTSSGALAVAVNSPMQKASDFNGKTVGMTALRSLDQIAAFLWLDRHGGDSSTVKAVEVPQPAMADAVAAGRVDGVVIADPALTAGIDEGKVRIFSKPYDSFGGPIFLATWFASQDWADRNPDVVRKYAAAINAASAWAVKNPEAAATVLRKYMKVTFTRAHEYHAQTLDPSYIQRILDAAAQYKMIAPMKATDLIWKG